MCLAMLLRAGADPNARDLVAATSLHKAAAHGDTRGLKALLLAGGDIELPNMYGDRCIHRATANCRLGTSRILLNCGADPNEPNHLGDRPLHLACVSWNRTLAAQHSCCCLPVCRLPAALMKQLIERVRRRIELTKRFETVGVSLATMS